MAGVTCTNLEIVAVPGDDSKMTCRWKCSASHIAKFSLTWLYQAANKKTWVVGGTASPGLVKANGYYVHNISLPEPSACALVMFRVTPEASTHSVSYTDSNGNKKTKTEPWWTGTVASSKEFSSTRFDSNHSEFIRHRDAAYRGKEAFDKARADCDAKRKAKKWKEAVAADQTVQKRASEAATSANKAIAIADAAGYDKTSHIYKDMQSIASTCTAAQNTYKAYENTDSQNLSAAERKAKLDAEIANAKTCINNANKYVNEALTFRKQGKLANSATSEDKAEAEFESAAWWYGRASSNAETEIAQREYTVAQQQASEKASQAAQRASNDRSVQSAASERPIAPNANVSQTVDAAGNPLMSILMDIDCTSAYTDRILIYRDADGVGTWPLWKTLTRKVPSSGGPWNTQRVYDTSVQAGHSYRYQFRSATGESLISDRSDVYGPFNQRPSQPRNLVLKLAGDGEVELSWENTGKAPADSVEVQYSSWYNGDNAWIKNAASQIEVETFDGGAQKAVISGLEPGKTWYFRVRRTSDGGSAWATVKGGEEKGYVTASIKVPATPTPKLAEPSALKATKVDSTSVKLQWTDKLEDGAHYEVEHTENAMAWDNNAVADIKVEQYSNPGGKSNTYTVTGLESGKKHYFRLAKRMDGAVQAYAQAATHESRYDSLTVFCMMPVQSASLSTPASLVASKISDTSIRLTFNDTQETGESYEVWYTDSATAFDDNAMGDIHIASYDELTASSAKVYTVTGLARGRTWFFKVRKKSQAGAGPFSAEVSCRLSSETLGKPTGLKAAQADADSVTLSWTDMLEDSAAFIVQHTTNENAFKINAQGDIDEAAIVTTQAGATAGTYVYTATGLEKGKKHLFRVRKDKGALSVLASAASGPSRFDDYTCFFVLPEDLLPSLVKPTSPAVEKRGDNAVRITWRATRGEGDSYELQYTVDADAFAAGDMGAIASIAVASENATSHAYTVEGLDRGHIYYFRVRTVNDGRVGEWSTEVECEIEAELEPTEDIYAPTSTDSLAAYPLDGRMIPLSWTHNSSQNSEQSAYELEVNVTNTSGACVTRIVSGTTATSYGLDDDDWGLDDGALIEWRVRTCGAIADAWSPWSRTQSFRTFAPPVAGVALAGGDGQAIGPGDPLATMPLIVTIHATNANGDALDSDNSPIAYTIAVKAVDGYDGTGRDGRPRYVAPGEELFGASIDSRNDGFSPDGWELFIPARELALQNGELYEVVATVATSQGLRGNGTSGTFEPQWDGDLPQPTATVFFDGTDYCCRITPIVNIPQDEVGQPEDEKEELTLDEQAAMADWEVNTLVPEPSGDLDFELVEDPTVDDSGWPLRPGCTMDVYRIDSDGTPIEIASNMANDGQSRALDPHPSFGTCIYRVVAIDDATGMQSSCDFEVSTPVPNIVIQWDEEWESLGSDGQPSYAGARLELAYNHELSESYAHDVVLREYAGRAHPVSYYGTQRRQNATMAADLIRAIDGEQLAKARRLAAWPGDCYIREPNGTGYWANVQVYISHSHDSAAVPVSLDIRRVDNGD